MGNKRERGKDRRGREPEPEGARGAGGGLLPLPAQGHGPRGYCELQTHGSSFLGVDYGLRHRAPLGGERGIARQRSGRL